MPGSPFGPRAKFTSIQAPIGGLNGRDPIAQMPAGDAVALVNFIPSAAGLQLRGGTVAYKAASGYPIQALMPFTPPGTTAKLFAAMNGGIYDATNQGAFGAALASGFTSNKWQSVNFGTPGTNVLIAANFADPPQYYNGTSWAAITFTTQSGYPWTLNPNNLGAPVVYGSRVWFIEKGSLRVWFQPLQSIQSTTNTPIAQTAQTIDFTFLAKLGGNLVSMGIWTHVTAYTITQYAVFLTSAGEVFVYSGPDPTIATGSTPWSIVGSYRVAPPVGDRPMMQYGADLLIMTQMGIIPMSQTIGQAEASEETIAISDKIRVIFRNSYTANPTGFGWALQMYPKGALVIANVPKSDGTFLQYVLSADTNAWTQLAGIQSQVWGLVGDNLFFATTAGAVLQFNVGTTDSGVAIQGTVLPAYTILKTPQKKKFLLARPLYYGANGYVPPISVRLDYDMSTPSQPQGAIPAANPPWGSPWNTPWSAPVASNARWQTVRGYGTAVSVLVNVETVTQFRLDRIDLTYELGGMF